MGVLDDRYADAMLRPRWARIARALRHKPLTRLGHNPSFAYLAARTRFFDDAVIDAVDAGIRHVVVLGAGYDSRAWRLARPGVQYYEVDHPATQRDKRPRAPDGGPRYVEAELGVAALDAVLRTAGFGAGERAMFTVEGLTMYLLEHDVSVLLRTLAGLGGDGSRLAVNFGVGFRADDSPRARLRAKAGRGLVSLGREPFRFELPPPEVAAFLSRAGWAANEVLTGRQVGDRYLTGTAFPITRLSAEASVASATRATPLVSTSVRG